MYLKSIALALACCTMIGIQSGSAAASRGETCDDQGFALDDEEACMGLRCIAAVVYNDCAEPLAAISVSGMTSRLTDDRLPEVGQIVRDVAGELTLALGGVMPPPR